MRTLIALLLLASAARAETMLLAEFKWSQPDPVTLPTEYIVQAPSPTYPAWPSYEWRETVTSFPHTSTAPPEVLPILQQGFTYGPYVILWNSPQQSAYGVGGCATCKFDRLINNPEWAERVAADGWDVDLHVPQLGNALWGYDITEVERFVTADAQTIRLYGAALPVPEPAAWLIVLCGFVHPSTLALRSARLRWPGPPRNQ